MEEVIASFPATLVKHTVQRGQMHITSQALIFYTQVVGGVTRQKFPFLDISHATKRKSGLIPNAIKIYFVHTQRDPVIIGSLPQLDHLFHLIQSRIASQPTSLRTIPQPHPLYASDPRAPKSLPHIDTNANMNIDAHISSTSVNTAVSVADVEPAPLVWRSHLDPVDRVAAHAFHRKTERARGVLNAPVRHAFNVLFISDWIRNYHAMAKNRDLSLTEWARADDGYMTRELTFHRPLGYRIGPKETRVKEKQRYSFSSDDGVVVELEGQNLDAPYGDYFVVESFFELKPHDNPKQTLFIASLSIHFKKSTMLRGKIESGAMAETKIAFQKVLDLASKRIAELNNTQPNASHNSVALPEPQLADVGIVAVNAETSAIQTSMPLAPTEPPVQLAPMPLTSEPAPIVEAADTCELVAEPEPGKDVSNSDKRDLTPGLLRAFTICALIIVSFALLGVVLSLHVMGKEVVNLEQLVKELRQNNGGSLNLQCANFGTAQADKLL